MSDRARRDVAHQEARAFDAAGSGSKDVFVHHSSIGGEGFKSLAEGAKVQYELEQGPKGPQAQGVSLVASD